MKDVILSGYYGYDNIGDEAILYSLIKGLKNLEPDLNITVLSGNPDKTSSLYEVRAINRNNIFQIINELKRVDTFISGGGSLLQDSTSFRSPIYYLGIIRLARLFVNKIVFCCQGVGPIKSNIIKKFTYHVLKNLDDISVRDKKSYKFLREINIPAERIRITTDPVFLLFSEKKQIKKLGTDSPVKLGISVRPWAGNEYIHALAEGVDAFCKDKEVEIMLIPFHEGEDEEVSEYLEGYLENKNIKILSPAHHPQEMLAYFGEIDILLGVRLHSLIFAAISKTPFLGVSYDPKIDGFLQQLNWEPVGTTDLIKPDLLNERLNFLLQNKNIIEQELFSFSKQKKQELEKLLESIL
ncbi:MAG: polysaccharide pyruvyl transferase CsaB [Bacillota bacterium]